MLSSLPKNFKLAHSSGELADYEEDVRYKIHTIIETVGKAREKHTIELRPPIKSLITNHEEIDAYLTNGIVLQFEKVSSRDVEVRFSICSGDEYCLSRGLDIIDDHREVATFLLITQSECFTFEQIVAEFINSLSGVDYYEIRQGLLDNLRVTSECSIPLCLRIFSGTILRWSDYGGKF